MNISKENKYDKYGLRPSNTITAEDLEDKVSPSTPTASLSIETRPKHLTRRLKSLQHETLQPENGLAHGICWQCNTKE